MSMFCDNKKETEICDRKVRLWHFFYYINKALETISCLKSLSAAVNRTIEQVHASVNRKS